MLESDKGSIRVEKSKQEVPTYKKMRDEVNDRKLVQLENDNFRSCLATSQIGNQQQRKPNPKNTSTQKKKTRDNCIQHFEIGDMKENTYE